MEQTLCRRKIERKEKDLNRKQEKRTPKKGKTWLPLIKQHISNHKREYCIVALLFLIGIVVGILFVNNMTQAEVSKTQEY